MPGYGKNRCPTSRSLARDRLVMQIWTRGDLPLARWPRRVVPDSLLRCLTMGDKAPKDKAKQKKITEKKGSKPAAKTDKK